MQTQRVGSTVLLAGGVVLVSGGLSSALGFSASGIVASLAAIAALLYAGGVWFGASAHTDSSVILFTHDLMVAGGALGGRRVADVFDAALRGQIEAVCRDALGGRSTRISCASSGSRQTFEASPVRNGDGTVLYGVLLSGTLTA
jgi:hypothetical protein